MVTSLLLATVLAAPVPESPDAPRPGGRPSIEKTAQAIAQARTQAGTSGAKQIPPTRAMPVAATPNLKEESQPVETVKTSTFEAAAVEPNPPLDPDPPAIPGEFSVKIVAFQRIGGAMVRLSTDEVGPIAKREWWVEPPIEDFDPVPGTDGKLVYLATPHAGKYKVYCAAAGLVGGEIRMTIAHRTIEFQKGDSTVPARVAPPGARVTPNPSPADVIREAALAVESPSWKEDIRVIIGQYRSVGKLEDAHQVAAKSVPPVWKSYFDKVRNLTAGLRSEGLMASADHERQHLDKAADVLEALR